MKCIHANIIGLVLSFSTCFAENKPLPIPDNHTNGQNNATLPIERLSELVNNKSTLADVHKIFGTGETSRLTFKKTFLPKKYENHAYDVYRIIRYDAYRVNQKDLGIAVQTTWQESITITFFFDKADTLILSTINHRHNDGGGKEHLGKYHNIKQHSTGLWPDGVCDVMFHGIYETQRYQGSGYFGPVTTQKCQWLDKLKADVASGVVK